jgi:Tol biopolymer transport system component
LFNIDKHEERLLCEDAGEWAELVVYNKTIYYIKDNKLMKIDINTGCSEMVWQTDRKERIYSPHITSDGRYLSFYQIHEDKNTMFSVLNLDNKVCKDIYSKSFDLPFYFANHGMICPTDQNMIFFAHEGTTYYITNRLWIANGTTKSARNIAKQRMDENGNLGECFGHEMWSPDGQGLYFVKYPCSTIKPSGICYVDINTSDVKLIASKYAYWHVGVSSDGKKLIADTQTDKGYSEVVYVDLEHKTEKIVAEAKTTWVHPCHPHPQFSPNCQRICYTTLNEAGKVCVGIKLKI